MRPNYSSQGRLHLTRAPIGGAGKVFLYLRQHDIDQKFLQPQIAHSFDNSANVWPCQRHPLLACSPLFQPTIQKMKMTDQREIAIQTPGNRLLPSNKTNV
jgi:hypothetical protein